MLHSTAQLRQHSLKGCLSWSGAGPSPTAAAQRSPCILHAHRSAATSLCSLLFLPMPPPLARNRTESPAGAAAEAPEVTEAAEPVAAGATPTEAATARLLETGARPGRISEGAAVAGGVEPTPVPAPATPAITTAVAPAAGAAQGRAPQCGPCRMRLFRWRGVHGVGDHSSPGLALDRSRSSWPLPPPAFAPPATEPHCYPCNPLCCRRSCGRRAAGGSSHSC